MDSANIFIYARPIPIEVFTHTQNHAAFLRGGPQEDE
jgi:hypothetical protein